MFAVTLCFNTPKTQTAEAELLSCGPCHLKFMGLKTETSEFPRVKWGALMTQEPALLVLNSPKAVPRAVPCPFSVAEIGAIFEPLFGIFSS
jgi:hypothetical protein